MHLLRLIFREILYHKLNFGLGVISVAVAVGCLVGEIAMLQRHDLRTDQIIAVKEAETKTKMATLEDDYRKITKGLGFNVLILPREQNLSDLFADDYASHYMPESYVERLAKSRVATIQHLLPSLQQKLKWPETERTIILIGVRGEVPILQADAKKPMLEPVPAGTMVLGSELHRTLKLKQGDKVKLLGRDFTVGKLHPERGTKDDITIWISLKEAQELLGKPGEINGILALECVCAADSLDKVRAEIREVLPDTQVIEFQSQTLARAEARQRAAAEAKDAIAREKQNRAQLRRERESLAAILVPLVLAGSALWIVVLGLGNVRERRSEIGLLRALGVGARRIMALFLGRAVLMGVLGAIPGLLAGALLGGVGTSVTHGIGLQGPLFLVSVLGGAPLLAVLAGWLPAYLATQQDPASVLSEG
jgi:ABC-type lipoprotein release transport system permease subunit